MVLFKPSPGSRIKEARKAMDVSQKVFAARLGTTRRRVIAWEGDENMPSALYLQRIAALTDRPIEFFLDAAEATAADDEDARSMPLTRDEFEMLGELMTRLGPTLARVPQGAQS